MSGSLLRSAGRLVRRSIPQAQGSFHWSPVRLLSGGAGRLESSEHSPLKPNMGLNQRLESGKRICRAAENQKEWGEIASDVRGLRDKARAWEQRMKEIEKAEKRREKVLVCGCVLVFAFCVFA